MTTREWIEKALLEGKHITKFDLLSATNSVCMAQRIQEIRESGWNVKNKMVKGKGNLVEYYLEESEIERITGQKPKVEQSIKADEKPLENRPEMAQNDCQTSLGLFGEGAWW